MQLNIGAILSSLSKRGTPKYLARHLSLSWLFASSDNKQATGPSDQSYVRKA